MLFEVHARPTTQQALIDTIGVDPSKLVGLLNDLEADGLTVRGATPTSGDGTRRASAKGRSRLGAARRAMSAVEERLAVGSTRSSGRSCSPCSRRSRTRAASSKAAWSG